MALTAYQTALMALLQAPSSPVPLISTTTQNTYINTARNQVAADAECVRVPATLALTNTVQSYAFSTISIPASCASVMTIRSGRITSIVLDIRPWEWFASYYLPISTAGTPVRCAQQGQGVNGTLFFDPIPNTSITVSFDAVCLPIALTSDSTAEAIPSLWTDAIPFYAAWLALQSLQRQSDANVMFQRYRELVLRGRQMATPSELPQYLPGGMGAQMAATHQPLGTPPQPQGR